MDEQQNTEESLEQTLGDPPSANALDTAQALARAAVSAVPFVGGPAAELLDLVIRPSLARRQQEWLDRLAESINELRAERPELEVDALLANDSFQDGLYQASAADIMGLGCCCRGLIQPILEGVIGE